MSNEMNENTSFANSLTGWATVPPVAVEAVETWKAATTLIVDSPIAALRSDAYSGAMTTKNVSERLHDAALVLAAQHVAPSLVNDLAEPLAQKFSEAVLADADRIIAELSTTFDKYAAYIGKYAPLVPAGATPEDLLSTAGPDVLAAWQNLGIAESTLEQIATFRTQLSVRYGYPAPTPSIAAFLAPVTSADELHRAGLAWRGQQAVGSADSGVTAQLPEVRGGRWRHMLEAGFELHLNNASEADAVAAVLAPVAA